VNYTALYHPISPAIFMNSLWRHVLQNQVTIHSFHLAMVLQ